MSEPKASTDAQHLDLGALGDALGAIDDAVKEDGPSDKAAPAEDSSDSKHKSKETPPSPSKGAKKPNDSSNSGKRGGAASPDTLSPNSLRSQSPVSSSPPVAASDARDANSLSRTQSEGQKTPHAAAQMSREMQDKVKAVKGMFPTIEVDTIAAVLAAEDGNEENAINVLLSMSDDSAPPSSRQQPNQRSQGNISSDEALARSLAMQEDEAYARAAQAREDQRRYAQQQNQPGGRRPRGAGEGGFMSEFFGGRVGAGGGGNNAPSGRGGGGAASFFNELKANVQPLFDGKGPLAREREESAGAGRAWPASSASRANYDPNQLAYQPRVRKAPGAARSPPATMNQAQQQPTWGRGSSPQPPLPPRSQIQRQPQPQPQSNQPAWQQQRYGDDSTKSMPGMARGTGGLGASPRDTGKGRAQPPPEAEPVSSPSSKASGKAAVKGVGIGAATGAAATSTVGASSDSSAAPEPPAGVASVLAQGGHNNEDERNDNDDDDDDDDDLEYQKSPFDDDD